jgi:hypothetical protein
MSPDPEKARDRKRRYLERKKVEKYGPDAAEVDMRGRHGNHATGARNARWNNERIASSHGYVKIRVGRDHPLADPNGYAYEHLLVWIAAGRPAPGAGEILHHRNENKTDNRLSNLQLHTRSGHAVHHNTHRSRDEAGRFLPPAAVTR